MKKLTHVVLVLVFSLLMATTGLAKDWSHPSGFKFTLPDNYKVETKGDVLIAQDPTGDLGITFFPVKAEKLSDSLDAVEAALKDSFQDLHLGDAKEGELNGMDYISFDGTGKVDGTPADVSVMVFTKNGKFLVVFGAVASSKAKKFEPALIEIFKSLK
ncbi:MAG: hypothetical protein K1Y36_27900 [Blastocatellia bacterium]|nr:hypothetical protein [Blastocatellia bacterium]